MSDDKKGEIKTCGVCGDRALGCNFNAVTCESCKAFFRRNAVKNKEFVCPFSNKCKVDVVTRRFCQKCRLQKCFDIGMKKEWILTEEEKKVKREKIAENRHKRKLPSSRMHDESNTVIKSEGSVRKVDDDPPCPLSPQSVAVMDQLEQSHQFEVTLPNKVLRGEDSVDVHTLTLHAGDSVLSPLNASSSDMLLPVTSDLDHSCNSIQMSRPTLTGVSLQELAEKVVSPEDSGHPRSTSLTVLLNRVSPTPQFPSRAMTPTTPCPNPQTSGEMGNDHLYFNHPFMTTKPSFSHPFPKEHRNPSVSVKAEPEYTPIPQEVFEIAMESEFSSVPIRGMGCYSKKLSELEHYKLNELIVANEILKMPLMCGIQDPSLLDVINMTDHAIRRLIKMSKRINGFKSLCQEDQIALLKGGCTELMILRSVMTYDPEKECWQGPKGPKMMSIKVNILKEAKGGLYEEHKRFITSFDPAWRTNENIMLILGAITLFTPERPNVIHWDVIKLEQDTYYYLLRRYLETLYSSCEARSTYLKLIHRLQELHILNENHVQVFLDVNPRDVEPLLIEIFDLK